MKRLFSTLLIGLMLLTLMGCSSGGYTPEDSGDYVTLGKYKGLTCPKVSSEVTDYRLLLARNKDLAENGYAETDTTERTEGTVQISDNVVCSFEGLIDGMPFDGNSGEDTLLIGSDAFIPGFEEGLLGAEIGSTVSLALTFPHNYHTESLAGKDVTFKVTVKKVIARVTYAELTDEVAASLGYDSAAAYEEALHQRVSEELRKQAEQEQTDLLWAAVLENAAFEEEFPAELSELAAKEWARKYTAESLQLGFESIQDYMTANALGDYATVRKKETADMVKSMLVTHAIVQAEGYELTDELYEEQAKAIAAAAGYQTAQQYVEVIGEEMMEYHILLNYAQRVIVENANIA
ncbi:MAG: FKBP-type peptidyl-prolyl cis-trans isomerase [Clostridia bacterium]|nr:FKBP-type peptidyl-prolyl cis-trans isomerase [Clostridia bacterium]